VPGLAFDEVYRPTEAIVTKRIEGVSVSSASAPEVMAIMLEQLDPRPGDHVLEIGAGTGYNAALLAHIVGDGGRVVTLDIDEDLVLAARAHLAEAGYDRVEVEQADGALGYPTAHPYDRIILSVAAGDIAPAWRDQLARPHGRIVLPLMLGGPQRSVAFYRDGEDLVSDSIKNCSFIPLRGLLGLSALRLPLDHESGLVLSSAIGPLPATPTAVAAMLRGPLQAVASGVRITADEFRDGLHLWMVSRQPGVATLWGGPPVPDLFGLWGRIGSRGTVCVLAPECVAVLAWGEDVINGGHSGELIVLASPGGTALALTVVEVLRQWQAAGRPDDAALVIRASPRTPKSGAPEPRVIIEQRWTRFALTWDQPPAILTV
jgi:protein-L-isoaspartate(D-aspartate) O-methyltransferase